MSLEVALESGSKRVFAIALDWPGWCRAGKEEEAALAALADAGPRYAAVAAGAGLAFRPTLADRITVVERVKGDGTTDFGAPGRVTERDRRPLTAARAKRRAALVRASWAVFDAMVVGAPSTLKKGPRGGGRDRDPMVEHVLASESAYARKIGVRMPAPATIAAAEPLRAAIIEALVGPAAADVPKGWPVHYAAHRIAWHVLDHAWEMEDKS